MDKYQILSGSVRMIHQDIPDHEVLLSFNNDDDARAFVEWFTLRQDDFESFADSFEEF